MKEYLTDEELELLIEQLETRELYAPKHMKEQILGRAFPKQTAEALPKSGGAKSTVQLFSYRLKIIAGMAAALLMLVLLPMQGELRNSREMDWEDIRKESREEEHEQGPDLNYILNGGVRRAGEKLNAWVGALDRVQLEGLFGQNKELF